MNARDHDAFARALLDPRAPCPPGLVAWNGSDPATRLDVYRNNVVASLVDALAQTFPVVRELVGEPFFAAMAAQFVRRHPPCSPVLAHYGERLPDFIAEYAPAAVLPYLPDVGRLEHARVRAFHATDAPVLSPDAIAAAVADPARLPSQRWALQPSLALVPSRFAIVSIWAAHQGEIEFADVDIDRAQHALVVRQDAEVLVVALDGAAARFVDALKQGATLGDAAAQAAADPAFDLATTLAVLVRTQAFAA